MNCDDVNKTDIQSLLGKAGSIIDKYEMLSCETGGGNERLIAMRRFGFESRGGYF